MRHGKDEGCTAQASGIWIEDCNQAASDWNAMPALFTEKHNTIAKLSLIAIGGILACAFVIGEIVKWSPYMTQTGVPLAQPVAFSHRHHVKELGFDCRYCHTSVEKSSTAGLPQTHICMTCHSQIWTNSKLLEPVRRSWKERRPLAWNCVYRLPRYVYFDHSIHIAKGVGCSTCHDRLDEMPITWKARAFYMRECLACHRQPERYLRPIDQVFAQDWTPPSDQLERGREFVRDRRINKQRLMDCYTCHR